MQPLKAGFLFIGNWDRKLEDWGIQIASDLNTAKSWIEKTDYDVVVLTITNILEKKFADIYKFIKDRHPATQFIASVPNDFSSDLLASLHEQYHFFRILQDTQDPEMEKYLYAAIEEANQRKQDENLVVLIREQTNALKKLQYELEQRVEKRTRYLTEARRKLFVTNRRIEGLKKALIAVHQASSVSEMESTLVNALAPTVQASWIRIFFSPQDDLFEKQLKKELNFSSLKTELYKNHIKTGSIFFMRAPDSSFSKEESDFLNRVAETVSLALGRIQKLSEIENIKEQWETTFNAMSEPVVMIDPNYDILQHNNLKLKDSNTKSKGKKCYQVLFGLDKPCNDCHRGQNFRLTTSKPETQHFEVFSQSILLDPQQPPVFVNQYHDVTDQTKMEQQIVESARLAELGTIGSSIAHELNNPLAGIISFTQLIKMDLPKDHPLYPDILEMEAGALRCKEIIQNLLGFTRDPGSDTEKTFEMRDVIQRALKIIELKTKSAGITVSGNYQKSETLITGHYNLLAQALKNILQAHIDLLLEKKRENPSISPHVVIDLDEDIQKIRITIRNLNDHLSADNKNFNTLVGLALPVATQILRDHNAKLDFELGNSGLYLAKISFPRPVLGS